MNLAVIEVSGLQARTQKYRAIPAGIIGATVTFVFTDPVWNSYQKTAVFAGCETRDVLMDGDTVVIPHEAVAKAGQNLRVGVYGVDADNNVAIPTLWAVVGTIREAADPSGDPSADPTLPIWAEIQKKLGKGIPTKVSELENDAGYLTGSGFLTDAEIELLNTMLTKDTLISEPEMAAVYTSGFEESDDPDAPLIHFCNVTATITNINKAFIQKAEVGIVSRNGVITNYEWYDAEITFGDTEHTVFWSDKKPYASPHAGLIVKLTYYSLIGGTNELTVEAVYNG